MVSASRRRLYRYINNSRLFVLYIYLPAVRWYDVWKGEKKTYRDMCENTPEPTAVVTDWKTWLTREEDTDTDTCKNKFKYTHTYIINTARVTNAHVENNKRRLPLPRLFIYVGCVLSKISNTSCAFNNIIRTHSPRKFFRDHHGPARNWAKRVRVYTVRLFYHPMRFRNAVNMTCAYYAVAQQ